MDGVSDDLARALRGGLTRFGLEALHQVRGIALRIRFDLFDQQLLRLVLREAGHTLQFPRTLRREVLGFLYRRLDGAFASDDGTLAGAEVVLLLVGGRQPVGQRAGLVGEALFERDDLLPPLARMALRVG